MMCVQKGAYFCVLAELNYIFNKVKSVGAYFSPSVSPQEDDYMFLPLYLRNISL